MAFAIPIRLREDHRRHLAACDSLPEVRDETHRAAPVVAVDEGMVPQFKFVDTAGIHCPSCFLVMYFPLFVGRAHAKRGISNMLWWFETMI